MKKKFLVIGLLLWGCVSVLPAHAQSLSYTSFHSDIVVQNDASITVQETIVVNFTSEHHGIFRTIPYRFSTTNGDTAAIPITIEHVQQDGASASYTTSDDGTNLVVKIGNANRTITGSHTYILDYTAQAATNFFSDHDELYWNVTGDQWDAPLNDVSATVTFSTESQTASGEAPKFTQAACYTGSYGSTSKNCTNSALGASMTFTSHDFLTVVLGWPTGVVTKPADFTSLRTAGTNADQSTESAFQAPSVGVLAANVFVAVAVFGLLFWRWWKHGRDPKSKGTIIAQYDPPDHLRPAELYAVMFEQTPMKKLLPAIIIDLAVRGYIRITETTKATMLGLGHQKDYELVLLKPADEKLRSYEQSVLEVLFDSKNAETSATTMRLSELKGRKYTKNPFSSAMSSVMSSVVSDQYFTSNPVMSKIIVGILGGVLVWISIQLLTSGVFAWGGLIAGIIAFGFLPALPQRSPKGVEAAWVGHGFRLFIEKAEQYRIQWQERENIFETFLPYAMVFGLADKWSKALADVAKQPDWYVGSDGQLFNTMVFLSAMNSFSSVTTTSVVSAAASGGSGFGGGGFSGGGGGGGGGGGW